MSIARVKKAADIRGIYFSAEKRWRNCTIGSAYEVYLPGKGFFQADNLEAVYREIMKYPKEA